MSRSAGEQQLRGLRLGVERLAQLRDLVHEEAGHRDRADPGAGLRVGLDAARAGRLEVDRPHPMSNNWYTGNAADDADQHRGWLLGHFIAPETPGSGVRAQDAVEVKWGIHPVGQQPPEWTG
ncbi:hypothetical protein [Dactylosporangium sp. NPDC048998]|uniref:hypothetical protein n=1 Tax=Dactylosporangium sp. NPDC048998 TaxID=3363976 RepID=UPI00371D8996